MQNSHVTNPTASRKNVFPRVGAWAIVAGALCIIARLGHKSIVAADEPDPRDPTKIQTVRKDVWDETAPEAEVHFVDLSDSERHGETAIIRQNVPFSEIRQATYAEMKQCKRTSHISPDRAARSGYITE